MEQYKVLGVVIQNNKLIGYDLVSSKGQPRTVTSQQLYNAIMNKAIINAIIQDNKIVIQGEYNKRVIQKTINIPFTEEEIRSLQPYISKIYKDLANSTSKDNRAVRSALSHLSQAMNLFDN